MPTLDDLADVQHQIWSHWMNYLFEVSQDSSDGSIIIPADKVQRWKIQASTSYKELSTEEKDSDLEQAKKVMILFEK